MFIVVEDYSTSQFSGECLSLLRVHENNFKTASTRQDYMTEARKLSHEVIFLPVMRQKASTDARENACKRGARQSEHCDLCKLMT